MNRFANSRTSSRFAVIRLSLAVIAFPSLAAAAVEAPILYGTTTPAKVREAFPRLKDNSVPETSQVELADYGFTGLGLPPGYVGESIFPRSEAIILRDASFSPTVASPLGFPTYLDGDPDLSQHNLAEAKMESGADYRYGATAGAPGEWVIRFDGVPGAKTPVNFDESKIDSARQHAINSIRANPYGTKGYELLFQSRYEAIVPWSFAGNEWLTEAEIRRLTPGNTIHTRISALTTARNRFRTAVSKFHAMLNDPYESRFLWQAKGIIDNSSPAWAVDYDDPVYLPDSEDPDTEDTIPDDSVRAGLNRAQTWPVILLQAYGQAIAQLGQAQLQLFLAEYFRDYGLTSDASINTQMVSRVQAAANELDMLTLALSSVAAHFNAQPFLENLGNAPEADALRQLAEAIKDRGLFFGADQLVVKAEAQSSNGTTTTNLTRGPVNYRAYGPFEVPFLTPSQLAQRPFTFDNLIAFVFGLDAAGALPPGGEARAGSLLADSKASDTDALIKINATSEARQSYADTQEALRSNYEQQLQQLCGTRADAGVFVPDIVGCFLPPGERSSPSAGESDGAVGEHWRKIEQAETRLLIAIRALDEIFEEQQNIELFGEEKLKSYRELYELQIANVGKLSALDYQAGAIRAETIQRVAKAEQEAQKRRGWFKAIASFAVRGVAAYLTGGLTEAFNPGKIWSTVKSVATGASGLKNAGLKAPEGKELDFGTADAFALGTEMVGSVISGHKDAAHTGKIADIRADEARRLAAIDAQRTRIRQLEAAAITKNQMNQEEFQLRERIRSLMIQVERRRLDILLAEQQVDLAEVELANTFGRISYLLQEYRKAGIRAREATFNRPDVRVQRDHAIRSAERDFRLAQEYAFLCARAADYRFYKVKPRSSPSSPIEEEPFVQEIRNLTTAILQAQNAEQLEDYVAGLLAVRFQFLQLGGVGLAKNVRISVRDHLLQINRPGIDSFKDVNNGVVAPSEEAEDYISPFPFGVLNDAKSSGVIAQSTPDTTFNRSIAHFRDYLHSRTEAVDGSSRQVIINFPLGIEPSRESQIDGVWTLVSENPLRTAATDNYGQVIWGPGTSLDSNNPVGVFLNFVGTFPNPSLNFSGITVELRAVGATSILRVPPNSETVPLTEQDTRLFQPSSIQASSQIRFLVNAPLRNSSIDPQNWRNIWAELSDPTYGTALHERSPFNDQWVLTFKGTNSRIQAILNNILDIEIGMTIRGWPRSQ